MFTKKSTQAAVAGILCAGILMMGSTAHADRWYHSKGAWATYGFLAGALLTDWSHHDACYPAPAPRPRVYRPYRAEPVYYPAHRVSDDSYYRYKQTTVFPFYNKVDVEVIPALPPLPEGRGQTVSLADRERNTVKEYHYYYAPEPQGNAPAVEEKPAESSSTQPADPEKVRDTTRRVDERVTVMQVSNRAGYCWQPAPETAAKPAASNSDRAVPRLTPRGDEKPLPRSDRPTVETKNSENSTQTLTAEQQQQLDYGHDILAMPVTRTY